MTEGVLIQLITTGGVIIVAILSLINHRAVREVRSQVQNEHSSNLRHDLDAAADAAKQAKEAAHRTERYVKDLDVSLKALEHSLDRRFEMAGRVFGEHQEAFDQHERIAGPPAIRSEALKAAKSVIREHEMDFHDGGK